MLRPFVNLQTKMAIIAIAIVVPLVSVFVVYGTNLSQQFTTTDNSRLQVISSFSPLYEFSQIVGQDKIDVRLLIPVGMAPHDWEPTIKDVQEMQKSDIIVINGIGFENWVDNLVENNYRGIIVDTSNGIKTIQHDEDQHDEDQHDEDQHDEDQHDKHGHLAGDPHIWLNPVHAKVQVQNIANTFSNSDPKNREFYHTNAEEYSKQLDLLDSKIRNELSTCNSDFIVFHDAFSYFAQQYGLNQHTVIPTNNSHGDVTPKTLEKVILTAKRLDISIIFSEESISSKSSEIIADEIGGRVLVLSPLEVISDGTYLSKMTENLENLKEALCQ